MSLIEKTRTAFKSLLDSFSAAARSPFPEDAVQKEMEKEGWRFEVFFTHGGAAFMVPPVLLTHIYTPEGRPALNSVATEEDRRRYAETVAAKRAQLGLKP